MVWSDEIAIEIPSVHKGVPVVPFRLHRRIPLLRRPFWERDQARAELQATRDELQAELRTIGSRAAALAVERDALTAQLEALRKSYFRNRKRTAAADAVLADHCSGRNRNQR
jgi:hypothetical protein